MCLIVKIITIKLIIVKKKIALYLGVFFRWLLDRPGDGEVFLRVVDVELEVIEEVADAEQGYMQAFHEVQGGIVYSVDKLVLEVVYLYAGGVQPAFARAAGCIGHF